MSITELLSPAEALALPRLVRPKHVGGQNSWEHMIQNGALRHLYGTFAIAVDEETDPELRAQVIRGFLPGALTGNRPLYVGGLAAAWIRCGGPAPAEVDLVCQFGRTRPIYESTVVHSGTYMKAEVGKVAGIWVTAPERTIADLALWYEPEIAVSPILELLRFGASLRVAALSLERRRRAVGRPRARATLAAATEELLSFGARDAVHVKNAVNFT
ncbi:MAG: hypothetical protein FWG25_11535 [Promicromonosporaceae bacterium]|nr:hypothetical protein [Promicromonosporaceae bacterium]